MSAMQGRESRARTSSRPGGILALGLLVTGATVSPAQASPLSAGAQAYWNAYYTRALLTHAPKVEFPAALRNLQAVNGLLPQTPLVQYLEWRRSLNPTRFDYYHRQVGPLLAQTEQSSNVAPATVRQPATAPVPQQTQPVPAATEQTSPTPATGPQVPAQVSPDTTGSPQITPQVPIPPEERPPADSQNVTPLPPPRRTETIPEPGTLAIALALIGTTSLARRFRRRLQTARD